MKMNKSVSIRTTEHCHLIKAAGFDGVDYDFTCRLDELEDRSFEANVRADFERIAAEGLNLSQVHLSYLPYHFPRIGDGTYEAFEEVFLPILIKEIELTAEMGCKVAVNHMYFEQDAEITKKSNVRLIEKLLPTLEKCGVTLAVENIYGNCATDVHFTTADDLMYYTDLFNSEYVGVCLDTGHAVVMRQKPLELLKALNTRVKAVHLHSAVPGYDIHNFMYLNDKGYWPELFKLLAEIGTCRAYNFEIRPAVKLSEETVRAYYMLISGIADDIIKYN